MRQYHFSLFLFHFIFALLTLFSYVPGSAPVSVFSAPGSIALSWNNRGRLKASNFLDERLSC
jgi:YD repeat-containing protein